MADKLPWFPLYVDRFLGSRRVQRLSGDQLAAYVILLCEQWQYGHIPTDIQVAASGMPKGVSDAAVAYVVEEFFPLAEGRRQNPVLASIRTQQATKQANLASGAAKARARTNPDIRPDINPDTKADISHRGKRVEVREKKKGEDVFGVPESVLTAAAGYLSVQREARVGILRGLVQGMTGAPVPAPILIRALEEMRIANAPFTANVLRGFCRKAQQAVEGEAGRRAAQGDSSVLGQPDAKQGPSVWFDEDEAGDPHAD